MEIQCAVQQYAWGKIGSTSAVAKLSGSDINENSAYAELWMGTHPSGPSILKTGNVSLKDWIFQNPSCLEEDEKKRFGVDLPYLFKVLAVGKALSIQAHPNKEHAEVLHRTHPQLYKDPNHKPEMAIPIFGDFEALCGFRPVEEIANFVERIPALQKILGQENVNLFRNRAPDAIKESFTTLMKCTDDLVKEVSDELIYWLSNQGEDEKKTLLGDLFMQIYGDFPNDGGCFCIYFLNHIILKRGEAMFLGPNIPHAYLQGDCIECMACSDNVVRAGLTPKFKDVETLCSMLDYRSGTKDTYLINWKRDDQYSETCRPPVPDFAVSKIVVKDEGVKYDLLPRNASILLIIEGSAIIEGSKTLKPGSTLFIPANQRLSLAVQNAPLVAYQAFSNVGVNIVSDLTEKGSCFSCLSSK